MRLSTSTNILFERKNADPIDPIETVTLCHKAGFEVLDFCFHDLTTYDSQFMTGDWRGYIGSVRELADSLDIEFSQGHAVVYDFCRTDIDHLYFQRVLEKCIEGAGILGIKWLVFHPSTVRGTAQPYKDSKKRNVDFFTKWCKFARKFNVGLAIENMWDYHISPLKHYCTTAEELIDLADAVPGLGVCWDAEHGAIMQQNQKAAILAIGDRLKATHISDYTNERDIHLLPYLGHTDWNEVMEAFAASNYQGDFDLEIHRYLTMMPMANVPTALRLSYEVGQGLLELYQLKKVTIND